MSERFFVPAIRDVTRIEGVEAHHLLHVLRARQGERVTLFDGSGREAVAEIVALGRSDVETRTLEVADLDRELPIRVEFAMPLPKADRAGFLVEKLTELGVARLTPMVTERSLSSASGSAKAEKPEKLLRRSIDACKQCGRNRLLEIGEPTSFADVLANDPDAIRWIADAQGPHANRLTAEAFAGAPLAEIAIPKVVVLVGPEGGFTEEERTQAKSADWQPVGIGRTILRMETAAIGLAAVIAASAPRCSS
ncbi:MAG TPA: RsmE family RNA methyltransferase [Pirellulaceae bacterium]|jgi:16S rRNA (uracil1498-N3)-methyltransferase|nr:RsmE family RNA methyltransferase [Pirellulaceae bacterium]